MFTYVYDKFIMCPKIQVYMIFVGVQQIYYSLNDKL